MQEVWLERLCRRLPSRVDHHPSLSISHHGPSRRGARSASSPRPQSAQSPSAPPLHDGEELFEAHLSLRYTSPSNTPFRRPLHSMQLQTLDVDSQSFCWFSASRRYSDFGLLKAMSCVVRFFFPTTIAIGAKLLHVHRRRGPRNRIRIEIRETDER